MARYQKANTKVVKSLCIFFPELLIIDSLYFLLSTPELNRDGNRLTLSGLTITDQPAGRLRRMGADRVFIRLATPAGLVGHREVAVDQFGFVAEQLLVPVEPVHIDLHDGDGLWLRVRANGRKFWCLRYMLDGKAREMGLGPGTLVTLAEARELAREQRRLVKLQSVDPIEARRTTRSAARLDSAIRRVLDYCVGGVVAEDYQHAMDLRRILARPRLAPRVSVASQERRHAA